MQQEIGALFGSLIVLFYILTVLKSKFQNAKEYV